MKTGNTIKIFLSALILSFALSQCSSSQKVVKLTSSDIKNMIDSSHFIFVAERVIPLRGSTRYLTSRYDVVVKKDSLDCYLPYFGRAYQAPIDPTKGGIQFTSVNFSYQINTKNKNQWKITINPADNPDVQQLYFNIFDNGNANLNVVSTHRDAISFDGYIEKIKK
ncbi:MAG: DUF4251 domain-containing protein [Ginsengibacter sp.]